MYMFSCTHRLNTIGTRYCNITVQPLLYVCTHVCVHACVCMHICVYMHACVYVWMHAWCVYTCMYVLTEFNSAMLPNARLHCDTCNAEGWFCCRLYVIFHSQKTSIVSLIHITYRRVEGLTFLLWQDPASRMRSLSVEERCRTGITPEKQCMFRHQPLHSTTICLIMSISNDFTPLPWWVVAVDSSHPNVCQHYDWWPLSRQEVRIANGEVFMPLKQLDSLRKCLLKDDPIGMYVAIVMLESTRNSYYIWLSFCLSLFITLGMTQVMNSRGVGADVRPYSLCFDVEKSDCSFVTLATRTPRLPKKVPSIREVGMEKNLHSCVDTLKYLDGHKDTTSTRKWTFAVLLCYFPFCPHS